MNAFKYSNPDEEKVKRMIEMFMESQVQDMFRNFSLLSRFLSCPDVLRNQTVFSLTHEECSMLVNSYYNIEESVMREFLNIVNNRKNMQPKNKIQRLEERTQKPAIVCKRIDSNFERIYKFASQMTTGNIVDSIQCEFLFPLELAQKYERLLFLYFHKFDCKRKMENVKFSQFETLADALMENFCKKDVGGFERYRVDSSFAEILKGVKNILTREATEEIKSQIMNEIQLAPEKKSKLERDYQSIIKAILTIGSNIDQPREFRDFFKDIVEQIRIPLSNYMTKKEISNFFKLLQSSATSNFSQSKKATVVWSSYVECLRKCVGILHRST